MMTRLKRFATQRPVWFVLVVLLAWLAIGGVLVGLLTAAGYDTAAPGTQMTATLGATFALIGLAAGLGWLRAMGLTRSGGWQVWLVTAIAVVIVCAAYLYAFFGRIAFDLSVFGRSHAARGLIARQAVVGFTEETLFRGVLLYALVRVWGATRRGVLLSAGLTAVLFAVVHSLAGLAGIQLPVILAVWANAFVSGVWYAAVVLQWGSLWPVMLLHGLSNLVVQAGGFAMAPAAADVEGVLRATLFELPLMIWGVWLLWRMAPRPVVPETP